MTTTPHSAIQILTNAIAKSHVKGLYTHGSRSGRRTEELHQGILQAFGAWYAPNTFTSENIHQFTEFRLESDSTGSPFNIDIHLPQNNARSYDTFCIVKHPIKSYNKNRRNYSNSIVGDLQNIIFNEEQILRHNIRVASIEIIAESIPYIAGQHIAGWETPNHYDLQRRFHPMESREENRFIRLHTLRYRMRDCPCTSNNPNDIANAYMTMLEHGEQILDITTPIHDIQSIARFLIQSPSNNIRGHKGPNYRMATTS